MIDYPDAMKHSVLSLLFSTFLCGLTACSGTLEQFTPQRVERERVNKRGKLTGDGLSLFGREDNETGSSSALGVNSFLWRASLDTVSFLPLRSADPFGGVIITDWYEDPANKGERYKLDILITDKALRVDALKVNIFRQVQDSTTGRWMDAETNNDTARSIEDAILTRARELRLKSSG